jgi:hypothetical protein
MFISTEELFARDTIELAAEPQSKCDYFPVLLSEVASLCCAPLQSSLVPNVIKGFMQNASELIGAILLVRRLTSDHRQNLVFTHENIDGVLLTAWLVSHKMVNDIPFTNRSISFGFGVDLESLNALERQFMALIDFRLGFSKGDVQDIINELHLTTSTK